MRLPRFRVRTLMIAVACVCGVLGIGLEAARLSRVRTARRLDAISCETKEWLQREFALESDREAKKYERAADAARAKRGIDPFGVGREARPLPLGEEASEDFADILDRAAAKERRQAAEHRRVAEHWATMRKAYLRAARYPWLPVPPDPFQPQ